MSRFEDALRFAVEVHSGMTRRTEGIPYVLHPMEVATIAASMTSNDDVLCAALLHDVVEDTPTTMDEVRERFGERVAQLVASETEDKRPELPAVHTWQVRKEESLDALRASDDHDVHVLWLSDKLANMRSFARLHERLGDAMWANFNQKDPRKQAWYYRSIAQALRDLSDTAAWREYDRLTEIVFKGVK